jgi:hypothetical protein
MSWPVRYEQSLDLIAPRANLCRSSRIRYWGLHRRLGLTQKPSAGNRPHDHEVGHGLEHARSTWAGQVPRGDSEQRTKKSDVVRFHCGLVIVRRALRIVSRRSGREIDAGTWPEIRHRVAACLKATPGPWATVGKAAPG